MIKTSALKLSARLCMYSIALSVLLGACTSKKDRLAKLWFFTYSSGTVAGNDTLLNPVSFLQLRADGTYTRDFGKFEHGTWHKEDQELFLKDHQGKINRFHFTTKGKEMQLSIANRAIANFESQPLPETDLSENPFAKENNEWRIPAAKKENDNEIKERLYNHCRFWEAYFTWALKKEYKSVDVRSTPTPIKIYGNGFGLKPVEELPARWVSYFYDPEDCFKASDQLKYIFQHNNIAWGQSDNKFKMFISAFQQLQRHLK
ncbi:MAG: hypothetical protein WCF67_08150 [Chitinophagaceae bacterium]